MGNATDLAKFIKEKGEREFNPDVTRQQLLIRPNFVGSWGAHNWTSYEGKSLIFEVSGRIHTGLVVLTLGWEDLYAIHLFDKKMEQVGKTISGIYAEDLVYEIDVIVETPPN